MKDKNQIDVSLSGTERYQRTQNNWFSKASTKNNKDCNRFKRKSQQLIRRKWVDKRGLKNSYAQKQRRRIREYLVYTTKENHKYSRNAPNATRRVWRKHALSPLAHNGVLVSFAVGSDATSFAAYPSASSNVTTLNTCVSSVTIISESQVREGHMKAHLKSKISL